MFESIISQFNIPGVLIKAERFGSGLINDTFLCEFSAGSETRKYVLQRINTSVFKHPEQVMENVQVVTSHIIDRLRSEGVADPLSVTPALVNTPDNRSYFRDKDGAYWRMYHYLENGMVRDTVLDERHACEVGRGLGRFQALVSDLSPERLHDTLPGFHHTQRYLAEYDEALKADALHRACSVTAEREFVEERRPLAAALTAVMESGVVPIRIVHNDPKVNNIMVRIDTGEALCMLDLDTVKPGIVHFDFGDCVRSAANPAGEDAPDLDRVVFDISLFKAITRGYLREAGAFLTGKEIELLPLSVKVITFELGIRFLADYLRGDTYFKTRYPEHNLYRSRVQFKLLSSMEKSLDSAAAALP